MSRAGWAAALALLALTALAYAPGVSSPLLWDDRDHIADNPRLQSLGGLAGVVSAPQGRYYRPLIFASYAAERCAWGLSPIGFHLTNLLLHLANVALLLVVARRIGVGETAALGGAALFALHPIQSEAVVYVSGRTDLLVAFGALLSCLAWLRDGPPLRRGVLAALAGAIAMLSKESGFAIVLLWLWLAWRGPPLRAPLLAPGLLLAALLLALRRAVMGGLATGDAVALPDLTTLAGAGWAILAYLRLLIWPATLQVDRLLPLPSGGVALVGLLVLGLAAALALRGGRRRDAPGMWSVWTAAFYLPAANLVAIYPALAGRALFVPEHNLYAPLAGLAILCASALARALRRAAAPLRAAVATVAVLALFGLGLRTAVRVLDWRTEATLFGAAVAAGSLSPRVWFNFGNTLLARRDFRAAADAFAGAVERAPEDGGAWANLAVARQQAGDLDGAADAYARAIALRPDDAQLFENLGSLALRRSDPAAARAAFTRALQLDPQLERSRRALAALSAGMP